MMTLFTVRPIFSSSYYFPSYSPFKIGNSASFSKVRNMTELRNVETYASVFLLCSILQPGSKRYQTNIIGSIFVPPTDIQKGVRM